MIHVIDPAESVRGLWHVDAGTIKLGLLTKWQHKTTTLLTSVQAYQMRAIPDAFSSGMKTFTYGK